MDITLALLLDRLSKRGRPPPCLNFTVQVVFADGVVVMCVAALPSDHDRMQGAASRSDATSPKKPRGGIPICQLPVSFTNAGPNDLEGDGRACGRLGLDANDPAVAFELPGGEVRTPWQVHQDAGGFSNVQLRQRNSVREDNTHAGPADVTGRSLNFFEVPIRRAHPAGEAQQVALSASPFNDFYSGGRRGTHIKNRSLTLN